MKHIIVTGASGLVGRHLIDRLLKEDYHIYALYNSSTPIFKHKKLTWIKCDLEKELLPEIDSSKIDILIHCAALIPTYLVNDETCYNANSIFDAKVFDFCRRNISIKIVYLSSIYIERFKIEELVNHSQYLYGKWQSEQELKAMINTWVSFRISSPYGKYQTNRNVLQIFIDNAIKGEDLLVYGTGNRTQDFISANDIAEVILIFIKSKLDGGIFNICSSKPVSMKELAMIVKNASDKNIAIVNSGEPDSQEDYRVNFDNSLAQRVLNWTPKTSLRHGINEWFKFSNA